MTGSMYAAVSGLKAHMSALNVIGNNVSNVNTLGYKSTRYTFNEALYTTQRSGSDGSETAGGRNPAQVGFGSSIGTIDLDMSTKNYTPTGKLLDTMIDGDGFFIVGDKVAGADDSTVIGQTETTVLKGMNLTRLGNFDIDPKGYLVDGNGSVVWGFVQRGATTAELELANSTEAEQAAERSALLKQMSNIVYRKDEEGRITDEIESATLPSTDLSAMRLPVLRTVTTTTGEGDEAVTTTTTSMVWPNSNTLADGAEVPSETTEEGSTIKYTRVQHDTVTINEKTGALTVMTSDGALYNVGYLAIAKVTNPNGVTHVDGRYYQAQDGAGEIRVTSVGGIVQGVESAGGTNLITGGLESSGTDLATEITNMITVQRGYQANTRIITVTDSMLEELVNMKR